MGVGSVDTACDTSDWIIAWWAEVDGWWSFSRRLLAKLGCATSQDGTRLFSLLKPESSVGELVATIIRKRVRSRRRKRKDAANGETPQRRCRKHCAGRRHLRRAKKLQLRVHRQGRAVAQQCTAHAFAREVCQISKAERDPDGHSGAHELRALPSSPLRYAQLFLFLFIFYF